MSESLTRHGLFFFVCTEIRVFYLDFIKSLEAQVFTDTLMRLPFFYPTPKRPFSARGSRFIRAQVLSDKLYDWMDQLPYYAY